MDKIRGGWNLQKPIRSKSSNVLLLAFPRHDTNPPVTLKRDIKSPKHARRIRKHFVTRKEPPRAKRHPTSKRTHHLRIRRRSFRQNRLDKPLRIEFLRVLAKVLRQVVLSVRWTNDVVSHSQGVAAHGGILDHGSVGRRGGMQSEGFVVESTEERAGVEKMVYLL